MNTATKNGEDSSVADQSLKSDQQFQLTQLTEDPTMDLHIRVTEQKAEALLWLDGRRYRLLGVRDEENCTGAPSGEDHGRHTD